MQRRNETRVVTASAVVLFGLWSTSAWARQPAPEAGGEPKPAEQEKKGWNVEQPPYETVEQTIDTTEGTWVSLDVGRNPDTGVVEVVFDLLGDLYLMPLTGGEPTRLTSGLSWDMQPRFSPDGRRIAFTSDRTGKNGKGGDNIWTVARDGSDPRQITQETFTLVNGPNWSPDGEFIVARKHFTGRRSLGAGEMWLYHRSGVEGAGSGGLQLTTKPTEQKDVNEPIFSPDGRYLYYSEDASPGETFEYNKDSNKQIYVVRRLDLQKGETEAYIVGPGGACRPTPSPDGRTLAFVRRVDGKTGLHLLDTASGAVRAIHDDLERDMQEAWAIHGVYPSIAWTPDGGSIVFWARGKIRKIDVGTRRVEEVPFRVRDARAVSRAQRVPIEPAPDEFDVRVLRWVSVSPRGDAAAYTALGKVYVRALPDGEPRRLTTQADHFEHHPSWSRDGRHIVYTAWNDDALGSVRVAAVDGSESWTVTTDPGHYADPVFSPDGSTVVYSKGGGGWLTSPLWSREQGIYRARARGGEAELVTRSGAQPHFGAASDRLFVTRSSPNRTADNQSLVSIMLDGPDKGKERTHYTSSWGVEMRVSPDGRWLAFTERFNVYLLPFVQTGRVVEIGPKTSSVPMARATSDAGEWVHFSGDSSKLHWSLGPTLYTRALSDSFAFLEGAPATLPGPTAEGVDISFKARHERPSGTLALVGGRLVTMRGAGPEVIEDGVIVIEGNQIKAVGPRASTPVPPGARTVDVSGQVVLPGFFDGHAHGSQASGGVVPQRNWLNYAQLAFGVTAVHDPSNDTDSIFAASELVKAGEVIGPRTWSTGTILYGAAGNFKAEIDSLEDARFHLRRMQAYGAWSVKSYNQPRRDQRQQVMAAARELGMMVVPEGGSTFMHNLTMIADGHTGLEHTFPVELVYDDVLDFWRGTGVSYTPTLGVGYGGLTGELYWYAESDVWRNERVAAYIPPQFLQPRAKRREMAPPEDYNHFRQARICKQAIDIGIDVLAGGHGQLAGINTHWEMWMFVQGGMTPWEALRSGTLHGARHFGMDHRLGSLEVGKLADIVVIDKGEDPLTDIRDSERIQYVVANGRLFEARTMNEVWPTARTRGPMFWEREGVDVTVLPPAGATCHGCQTPGLDTWAHP